MAKRIPFLEVEQESKKKAARTRNEEEKEREERAGEEKDNIKKEVIRFQKIIY
jgi:hypothetical protein